jgi:D-amino-acid dehydrogenase
VVGAGVIGVTTAYALARRGVGVTLVDREEGPARMASHANGSQLSYLYTDALANPHIIRQLPGLALGRNDSFRMRLRADPDYLRWLFAFLRNCTDDRFAKNTGKALELALQSRLALHDLLERHPIEFGYAVRGKMHLYHDEAMFTKARATSRLKGLSEADQRPLTFHEAAAIEPALLAATDKPAGVLYAPQEAVGDAFLFSRGLLDILVAQYGLTTSFSTDVTALEPRGRAVRVRLDDGRTLEADIAVVCTGARVPLLKRHGIDLPIQPMKGYSFTAPPGAAAPTVSLTDTSRRIVFTRLGNAIRMAGLADLGSNSTRIEPARMDVLTRSAQDAFPAAAQYDEAYGHWAGLRPMSPSSVPHIGRPRPTLAYNVGHGMLGWTLAMGSAERLARLVLDQSSEELYQPMEPRHDDPLLHAPAKPRASSG